MSPTCVHVEALLAAKRLEVQKRQREVAALEVELENLISRSEELDPAACTEDAICHIIAPGHEL